jgi:hypothetical protein
VIRFSIAPVKFPYSALAPEPETLASSMMSRSGYCHLGAADQVGRIELDLGSGKRGSLIISDLPLDGARR